MSDHRFLEVQNALEAYHAEMRDIQYRLAELRREEHEAWLQLRNTIFATMPDKLSPYFQKELTFARRDYTNG